MDITIQIKNCEDCKHSSHTGAFTKGGAKPCCNHDDTVKLKGNDCFKRVIPYKIEYGSYYTFKTPRGIPSWCPLKNGKSYE